MACGFDVDQAIAAVHPDRALTRARAFQRLIVKTWSTADLRDAQCFHQPDFGPNRFRNPIQLSVEESRGLDSGHWMDLRKEYFNLKYISMRNTQEFLMRLTAQGSGDLPTRLKRDFGAEVASRRSRLVQAPGLHARMLDERDHPVKREELADAGEQAGLKGDHWRPSGNGS